jgi:hypothetical protein
MDHYTPSRFDRMLRSIDRALQQAISFVTGEDVQPFEIHNGQWGYAPIPTRRDNRRDN